MKNTIKRNTTVVLALALFLVGSTVMAGKKVNLEKLPESVKKAATEKVEGIELVKAEVSKKKGKQVYKVQGTVGTEKYTIRISEAGKVLKVRTEASDEDDGEGHSCPHS